MQINEMGLALVKDSLDTAVLRSFNSDQVSEVIDNINAFHAEYIDLLHLAEADDGLDLEELKRALLIYFNARLEQLKLERQNHGVLLRPQVKEAVNTHETHFFDTYNANLNGYMRNISKRYGLDLDIASKTLPPKDLYISVRCNVDYGLIVSEYGTLDIKRNKELFVNRESIEELLKQGIVSQIFD